MAKHQVKVSKTLDQIAAQDDFWLHLGDLRELVKQADANGWSDSCLVSHGVGSEHPTLRNVRTARYLVVEGPL